MGLETAAVLGIASAASTAAGAGMSFAQAAKQSRLRREADEAAQKAIEEAKKAINVNTYAALNVPMLPYQLQREALAQATAQAMEAAKESGRGGGAMAGRVLAEAQQNQLAIASEQAQELARLEQLKAAQQKSIQDELADVSLAEAEGAQLASRQAEYMRNQAITQGVQQLGSLGKQIAKMPELYPQNKGGVDAKSVKKSTDAGTNLGTQKVVTPKSSTPFVSQNLPTQQRLPIGQGTYFSAPYLLDPNSTIPDFLQVFVNPFDVTGGKGG